MKHISVLLKESIDLLEIQPGDVFVDGTLGSAGHSLEVCKRFGTQVTIVGIDADSDALARSEVLLKQAVCRFSLHQGNFTEISKFLADANFTQAKRILLDIGVSSNQLEESGRGFSFMKDEPLLMTMKKESVPEDTTAWDIVNRWDEENIVIILRNYGEERFANRIAKAIVAARANFGEEGITTTTLLREIIETAVPVSYKRGKIHPATRTFQAIRIAVNDELGSLTKGLHEAFTVLAPGGRLAVISFHSLEDRIVKHTFREFSQADLGLLITKKPIIPTIQEISQNSRARSAKLRVIQKKF